MDKYQLIEKISHLKDLTNEEKSTILGLLRHQQNYGLIWEDKPEAVEEELKEKLPVLKEVKERAIINDTQTEHYPNHIIIEGDNLHAEIVLNYTHNQRFGCIYLDPPYNTGNKDFIYNDKFVDSDDFFRHSKWLSFMDRRLKLAKTLLADDGVIFISIDENEVAPLRIIGDRIFGDNNFVGQWNWFKSATPPALSKKIKRTVEYILCWKGKNNDYKFQGAKKTSKSNDPFTKPQNSYKTLTFKAGSITCPFADGVLEKGTYGTAKFPNELLDDMQIKNGKNANDVRFKNRFIWVQETLDRNIEDGLYIELSKKGVLSYKRMEYSPEVPPNFIDINVGVDTTENAGRALQEIFDNKVVFDYPKPVSLLKYLINFTPNKDIKILDFFAGSGTTLHATMQLNAEDGGHRQCILVTNNENGICENVTYVRNKRVIEGYTTPKGEVVAGLHKNNLRYYKTEFVPRERTVKNMRALVNAATDMLCIKENMYKEDPTFGQWEKLPNFVARHFKDAEGGEMLIIYDESFIDEIADAILNMDFKKKLKVYVFSPDRDPFEDEFIEVEDKVELCALPAAIYDAYVQVIPKPKEQEVELSDDAPDEEEPEWTNETV